MKVNPLMPAYLNFSVGKFTFQTATDRYYNNEGVWVKLENNWVRLGISDFLQQHSGDMAFVELKPVGTQVTRGDEIAVIETIKVNISLSSPISGSVIEVNSDMEASPEVINQDPYERGWMILLEPVNWEADKQHLLEPKTYFAKTKGEAEQEVSKE